ncbi:inosine triphosphate pyrophosphatase [Sitodiplosis mosellana]|uniref:inosine triphosphate pyrophosphatase n=1 Tax=Sitodiplosis mosellana TaxID=263140 RepID=UPI002444A157|nr:inosine triphosphate pyrophosphatase [Sitodiplosis mosellana]
MMQSKPITFITGNHQKLEEVIEILGKEFPRELVSMNFDLSDCQGEMNEISIKKCQEAAKHVQGPVIVEDICLCFNALGGMPGPYIKWFYDKIGVDGLYKMLVGFEDKSATVICTLAYSSGENEEVLLFQGKTEGTIVDPRGPRHHGFDACFQPNGFQKTYAELSKETKNSISHRFKAVDALKHYFMNANGIA